MILFYNNYRKQEQTESIVGELGRQDRKRQRQGKVEDLDPLNTRLNNDDKNISSDSWMNVESHWYVLAGQIIHPVVQGCKQRICVL